MKSNSTKDIEYLAFFGIDEHIDPNETVVVNLRDLVKVHGALGELVRFFHNRDHYKNVEDLARFMGSLEEPGGFKLLSSAYYDLVGGMLPEKLDELFADGEFTAPRTPYYFHGSRNG